MEINRSNLDGLFMGFKTIFNKGFEGAAPEWQSVATKVTSTSAKETYAWLGKTSSIRKWIGDRVINSLVLKGYTLENEDFEHTIGVSKNSIQDDDYGVFSPMLEDMGRDAALHPNELIFSLLGSGWSTLCYDGQSFFDTDHPVLDEKGKAISVANTDGGNGAPWYLLDTSRPIRPLIYQERQKYNLVRKDQETDDNVFYRKEYIYGVDGRGAAGYGFWQLAWGSKQTLDVAHYEAARTAMQTLKGDDGRKLGVKPTVLVVGPQLESAARQLIKSATLENGESNKWQNSVELIVTPWVE